MPTVNKTPWKDGALESKLAATRLGNGFTQSQMDDYSSLVDQYKGTGFDKILQSNPYLSVNRKKSLWESILSGFGLRTKYDVDLDQNALAANEYAAQVVQNAREEKYNSESEQVKRAAQAGLNPDLTGVSNAQATEFAQEQTTPQFAGTDESQLGQIASMCMDVLSASMGFSKDLQSLKILKNQVESGEIDNASSMLELAIRGVGLSPVFGDDDTSFAPDYMDTEVQDRVRHFFKSSRSRNKFDNAFSAASLSLKHHLESYQDAGDYESARKRFLSSRSSKYYDPIDETMQDLLGPIIRYSEKLNEKNLQKETKQTEYDTERLGALDPELSAEVENASNETSLQDTKMDKNVNSVLSDIISNLAKSAKNGNFLAQTALLLFSVLRPRIGYNSSSSTNAKGQVSSDKGFSFGL